MSKKSLFNKGLYISNLSRFKWGSILYFVLLFLSTSFVLLTRPVPLETYELERYVRGGGELFCDGFFVFPVLLAIAVPTVVAILVFRMLASKKQGVFVYSLPSTRNANYISTLLSGFTLMALPVILNGIILAIISFSSYGDGYRLMHCAKWIIYILAIQFVFFSVAALSAVITGNSFALVFVNVVLHTFLLIVAVGAYYLSDLFLYGFTGEEGFFLNAMKATPAAWVMDLLGNSNVYACAKWLTIIIFVAAAVLVYVLSGFLHGKRKIENNESVAGFEVLNPIFKYAVTLFGTILTFAAMKGIFGTGDNGIFLPILVIVISVIVYFAAEMLLKKTVKVFGAYKGYLAYAAVIAVVVTYMSQTSFFGYENRLPKEENIDKIAVYSWYNYNEPVVSGDAAFNEEVIKIHNDIIKNKPKLKPEEMGTQSIRIRYDLKNGKKLERTYNVKEDYFEKSMKDIYSFESYKKATNEFADLAPEDIAEIGINCSVGNYGEYNNILTDKRMIGDFISAWEKDITELSYDERYNTSRTREQAEDGAPTGSALDFNVTVTAKRKEKTEDGDGLIQTRQYVNGYDADQFMYYSFNYNSNFKNVMGFIKDNFGIERFVSPNVGLYMSKKKYNVELRNDNGMERFYYDNTRYDEFSVPASELVKINQDDFSKIVQAQCFEGLGSDKGECYLFFAIDGSTEKYGVEFATPYQIMLKLNDEHLKDYMREYLK